MAKQSQIDKAIEALDNEIAVLSEAKARLLAVRSEKPAKRSKPRVVKPVESQSA